MPTEGFQLNIKYFIDYRFRLNRTNPPPPIPFRLTEAVLPFNFIPFNLSFGSCTVPSVPSTVFSSVNEGQYVTKDIFFFGSLNKDKLIAD